ncbi:PAQR family membrane homeostasis protein TrhA [Acidithiobacillus ferrianus]|uniref:PAQR family membrane homeostasis protein TrhA n=1 Tax=Acidithiobacillus ferrianus TaxID=2678518 RepID=UPI0034E4231F
MRQNTTEAARRDQTRIEEWINSLLHGAGAALALSVYVFWLVGAGIHSTRLAVLSVSIFVCTILILYLASTIYHILPPGRTKSVFQLVDRSAIYLLIAGTYTPVTLMVLHDPWGWVLLALEWSLAAGGIVLLAFGGARVQSASLWLYLLMGWLAIFAAVPLYDAAPGWFLWWLTAGGVAYTVGVLFFLLDRWKYFHSIWHVFVVAGTALQFWAILQYAG